jgi:hypothetical protein
MSLSREPSRPTGGARAERLGDPVGDEARSIRLVIGVDVLDSTLARREDLELALEAVDVKGATGGLRR